MSFKEEAAYFRVTYPDQERLFPSIETFVYIGCNLSDEDEAHTYYFQPVSDYVRYGHAAKSIEDGRPVICIRAEEVAEMMDIERLVDLLCSINKRRTFKAQNPRMR